MTDTQTTYFGLNRKKAESLVWSNTLPDYRGEGTGERRICILRKGGTTSVALKDLTVSELTQRVEAALRFKHRCAFVKQGLVVNPRRTAWAGAFDLDGRAFVVNLVTGEKRLEAEAAELPSQEDRVKEAFRKSEAAADRLAGDAQLAA